MSQCATAHTGIQPCFNLSSAAPLALVFGEVFQLRIQLPEFLLWQAVVLTKGDGLAKMEFITMREISARIPSPGSAKPQLGIHIRRAGVSAELGLGAPRRHVLHALPSSPDGKSCCIKPFLWSLRALSFFACAAISSSRDERQSAMCCCSRREAINIFIARRLSLYNLEVVLSAVCHLMCS